jgi:AraC-like DNA-binding protein
MISTPNLPHETAKSKLTVLLQAVDIQVVRIAVIHLYAPGGIRFSASAGIQFYFVIKGDAIQCAASGDPRAVTQGEFALLRGSSPHVLCSSKSATITRAKYYDVPAADFHGSPFDGPIDIRVGSGRIETSEILTGILLQNRTQQHPLFAALPRATYRRACSAEGENMFEPMFVGPGALQTIHRFVELQVLQILREHAATDRLIQTIGRDDMDFSQISAARRMMESAPEHHWSVEQLAIQVGMSRSAFAAAFKHAAGCAPMHYLTRLRMLRAAELVRTTDASIFSISRGAGYGCETAFSRAFRRTFGVAPSSYRNGRPAASSTGDQIAPWDPFLR